MNGSKSAGFSQLLGTVVTLVISVALILVFGYLFHSGLLQSSVYPLLYLCCYGIVAAWIYRSYTIEGRDIVSLSWFEIAWFSLRQLVWGTAIMMFAVFAFKDWYLSRAVLMEVCVGVYVSLLLINRVMPRWLYNVFYKDALSVVIYSKVGNVNGLVRWIRHEDVGAYEVVGYFSPEGEDKLSVPFLGHDPEVLAYLKGKGIDMIYLDSQLFPHREACLDYVKRIENVGTRVRLFENIDRLGGAEDIERIDNYCFQGDALAFYQSFAYRVPKRLFDLAVAGSCLLAVVPWLWLAALVFRGGRKGPLFIQQGQYRRRRRLYPLRVLAPETCERLLRLPLLGRLAPLVRFSPMFWDILLGRVSVSSPYSILDTERALFFKSTAIKGGLFNDGFSAKRPADESLSTFLAAYSQDWSVLKDLRSLWTGLGR